MKVMEDVKVISKVDFYQLLLSICYNQFMKVMEDKNITN